MTAETSNARGEWVLVPREPTAEMVQASNDISCRAEGAEHWAAMLAAAPPPADARGDVRGLVAKWREHAAKFPGSQSGVITAFHADELEAALAAEGVQAGEVECDCPGKGKDDPALHAPNCPARLSQQPEPKAEARGVVDDGTVLVRLHRPEGYDDVHPQLVLDDAGIHPDFRAELAALTEARNG